MTRRAQRATPEPDRSRPWIDLSLDEKIERIRFAIHEVRSTLVDLQRLTDTLRRHKHDPAGDLQIPLGEIERTHAAFSKNFDENFL